MKFWGYLRESIKKSWATTAGKVVLSVSSILGLGSFVGVPVLFVNAKDVPAVVFCYVFIAATLVFALSVVHSGWRLHTEATQETAKEATRADEEAKRADEQAERADEQAGLAKKQERDADKVSQYALGLSQRITELEGELRALGGGAGSGADIELNDPTVAGNTLISDFERLRMDKGQYGGGLTLRGGRDVFSQDATFGHPGDS